MCGLWASFLWIDFGLSTSLIPHSGTHFFFSVRAPQAVQSYTLMHIFLASWLSPSRTFLERIVPRLDLAIKLTVLVAALLGLAYWRYSKQLQQFTKQELDKEREESEMGRLQMQSDIARANESTAKLEAEAEKLRGKNLELQDKLEKEHSERIELEKEVAPRSARIDVSKLGESLKQYAGVLYATRTIM